MLGYFTELLLQGVLVRILVILNRAVKCAVKECVKVLCGGPSAKSHRGAPGNLPRTASARVAANASVYLDADALNNYCFGACGTFVPVLDWPRATKFRVTR